MKQWIVVEDGRLLNLNLISDVRFDETAQQASAWGYETPLYAKSRILYDYFWPIRVGLDKATREKRDADTKAGSILSERMPENQ